jgi:thiol-disulfide isomerase/thioredoxin
MTKSAIALLAALTLSATARAQAIEIVEETQDKPFALMVGDVAPALPVGRWIKGQPVQKFGDGRVHVVEFWATWCAPCRETIPHLTELQQKYAQQKVNIIGVSVLEDDQADVEPFVRDMGDKMAYTVAMDSVDGPGRMAKGQMNESWMKAAGRKYIPMAFIVDGQGKIAWIGSPKGIDQPLADVVAGKWDLATATARYHEEMLVEARLVKVLDEVGLAMKQGDFKHAVTVMDAAIASDAKFEGKLGAQKFTALLQSGQPAAAYAYGERLIETVYAEEAGMLNMIAWTVVDPDSTLEHRDFEFSIKAAKRACELTEWTDPAILDTLALGLFESGNVQKAIKIQEKAVEHSIGTPYEAELKGRLEKFRKAVQG